MEPDLTGQSLWDVRTFRIEPGVYYMDVTINCSNVEEASQLNVLWSEPELYRPNRLSQVRTTGRL